MQTLYPEPLPNFPDCMRCPTCFLQRKILQRLLRHFPAAFHSTDLPLGAVAKRADGGVVREHVRLDVVFSRLP